MKELALNHLPELAPRTVESLNLLRLRLEQTAPRRQNHSAHQYYPAV